mgnify:CR=1 FL=1
MTESDRREHRADETRDRFALICIPLLLVEVAATHLPHLVGLGLQASRPGDHQLNQHLLARPKSKPKFAPRGMQSILQVAPVAVLRLMLMQAALCCGRRAVWLVLTDRCEVEMDAG